ncbi:hypothetical protein JHK85_006614 [Glycine max]|nr:hypothetical protein JHK85_006614 [Glycine max]KAG5071220.1 hypothetical protein JHK86_006431 [Glycine max]
MLKPNPKLRLTAKQLLGILLPDLEGAKLSIFNYLEFELLEEIIPANIERKANNVELPFSLKIMKNKLQWKEEFREAGLSVYCFAKKAFSSMVSEDPLTVKVDHLKVLLGAAG